jgi:GDPmannose 4,6-dehydratase
MPTALITGITGQDGVLLAEQLLARGDTVIGTTRRDLSQARPMLSAAASAATLRTVDLSSGPAIDALIDELRPDRIFHLAAPAAPAVAWQMPAAATDALCTTVARLLESVMRHVPATRLVAAGSSQVFGPDSVAPQNEQTPFQPLTPYGAGKAFATYLVAAFRDGRGLHASTAILFNHESARRQSDYVTVKICRAAIQIANGDRRYSPLRLGALNVVRDWGYGRDHMDALVRMSDAEAPGDYVIGTGVGRSVAQFCDLAFSRVGLDWRDHVVSDPTLARSGDVPAMVADPSRAKAALGWCATTPFETVLDELLDAARLALATEASAQPSL